MAHDNYTTNHGASQPGRDDASSTSFPPYPAEDWHNLPDPRHYQPHGGQPPPQQESRHDSVSQGRSRSSSNATGYGSYQPAPPPAKPIYDAVNSAFDHSSAANQLPQDVIQQITEQVRTQVIDSLRAELQQTQNGQFSNFGATSQPFLQGHRSLSPSDQRYSPRNQTPSPNRRSSKRSSLGSNHADSHIPSQPHQEYDRRDPHPETIQEEVPSRSQRDDASKEGHQERLREDLTGRYGDRSEEGTRPRVSPTSSPRQEHEETVIEKMWQPLFDIGGRPTLRLSQFLRGLAIHLIEDYEPKGSLVINPSKMSRYYTVTRLASEPYDWSAIFRQPSSTLSQLYRDLKCAHHFIQDASIPTAHLHTDNPSIPALTPDGFTTFMTLMIQAHPSAEFDRLSKVVRDMPISNADDRKERLPKELSRRLLPRAEEPRIRSRVNAAIFATTISPTSPSMARTGSGNPSYPPPPPGPTASTHPLSKRHTLSSTTHPFTTSELSDSLPHLDRKRTPYARRSRDSTTGGIGDPHHDSSAADLDTDSEPTFRPAVPLERERKPYTAKEGSGKHYESDHANGKPPLTHINTTGHGLGTSLGSSGGLASSYPGDHGPLGRSMSTAADGGFPTLHGSNMTTGGAVGGGGMSFPPPPREALNDPPSRRDRDKENSYDAAGGDMRRTYSRSSRHSGRPRSSSFNRHGSVASEYTHYGPVFDDEDEREVRRRGDRERERDEYSSHRHGSSAAVNGFGHGYSGANPPLGTGERRYG